MLYQVVRGILWKWKMPNKGKICPSKSYYVPMEQKLGEKKENPKGRKEGTNKLEDLKINTFQGITTE
jgi:hypothetical protein